MKQARWSEPYPGSLKPPGALARQCLLSFGAALCAALPLLVPEVWSGFRVAVSDPLLSVVAATERPLSVRSPGGAWALALALTWFGLGYRSGRVTPWEATLVVLGGAAALVRLGNVWLYAAAVVVPLARQLALARLKPPLLLLGLAASLGVGLLTLAVSRPPALPVAALQAAGAAGSGHVLADWRWAPGVQQRLGSTRSVLAAGGLASESSDFWLDYLRIAQGQERWSDALDRLNVDLVVLDASDQQAAASDLVRSSADWHVLYDAAGALVAQRDGS